MPFRLPFQQVQLSVGFQRIHFANSLCVSAKNRTHPKEKEEAFLNRFASSMLMPRKSLVIEFGSVRSSIGYDEMRLAKQKYGLSRTLMLYRLAEVGILSEQNAFLIRQKMVQNYHISRTSMSYLPLSFYEKPSVLYMLTHRAISEGYLKSEADLDFISSISLY